MPTINLLPQESREQERKELERAKHLPKKNEVVLTNPDKAKSSVPVHVTLPRESWWKKLFGVEKKPAPAMVWKPPSVMGGGPNMVKAVRPPEPKATPKPLGPVRALPPGLSWWQRWFGPKPAVVKPMTVSVPPKPKPVVPAKESPFVSPDLLAGVLPPPPPAPLKKQQASAVSSVAKPVVSPPPPVVAPKAVMPPAPRPSTTIPKNTSVKFTNLKGDEPKEKGLGSVTLLPEELRPQEGEIEIKFITSLVLGMVLSVAAVGAIIFGIGLLKLTAETKFTNAQHEREKIEADIAKILNIPDVEDENGERLNTQQKGERLQQAIATVKALLDQHIHWTKLFAIIQKHTHPEVQWKSMSYMATDRSVNLNGVGVSFASVAQQIVALKEAPEFNNVRIAGVSKGEGESGNSYAFAATMKLNAEYCAEYKEKKSSDEKPVCALMRGTITTSITEAFHDQQ